MIVSAAAAVREPAPPPPTSSPTPAPPCPRQSPVSMSASSDDFTKDLLWLLSSPCLVWPGGGGSCQVPCVSTSAARLPDPDTAAAAAEAGEGEEWDESYLAELRGEREQLAGTCGNNSHTLRLLDTGGRGQT